MATRPVTVTQVNQNVVKFFWETLTETNADGVPIQDSWIEYSDRSVQVTGNFGTGGHVSIEGSDDLVNYAALNDPFGVSLDISAVGLKSITEVPLLTRPRVTVGTGVDLDVTIVARRPPIGR